MKLITATIILIISFHFGLAQNTVGLIQSDSGQANGYLLLSPIAGNKVYLIDKCGKKINEWTSNYTQSITSKLSLDGALFRCSNMNNPIFSGGGGSMGRMERLDWNSAETWSYQFSDSINCQHHAFQLMPNGHLLLLLWNLIPRDSAVLWGKDTSSFSNYIWNEKILEVEPVGSNQMNIIWEWNSLDHIVQDFDSSRLFYGDIPSHPELIDFNYSGSVTTTEDIFHLNAIDYNLSLDQIMITSRAFSEIWIIDHSTSTAEAKGHIGGLAGMGGDLLYRWGNPRTYQRGTILDQKLFEPHDGHWIEPGLPGAGNILIFNNGVSRPDSSYSSVEEITPPFNGSFNYDIPSTQPYGPDTTSWNFIHPWPTSFYSNRISGSQRMINGNTLVCLGNSGEFFELNPNNEMIWKYINPVGPLGPASQGNPPVINQVFHINFYPPDFTGFNSQTLVAGAEVELNPSGVPLCYSSLEIVEEIQNDLIIYPNPASNYFTFGNHWTAGAKVSFYDCLGNLIINQTIQSNIVNIEMLCPGIYYCVITNTDGIRFNAKLIKTIGQ